MNITVSIVEDRAEIRELLAGLIDGSPGYQCVSQHPSAEDAFEKIPEVCPNVVLMDVNLPGLDGIECVRRLKPVLPNAQIIMLTLYQNTKCIIEALAAGASGYLLKDTPPDKLLAAIKQVHEGGFPMSSSVARKLVESFHQNLPNNLSGREIQVLDLLCNGYLYKEIADTLQLSFSTVHAHVQSVYKKLEVNTRTEAMLRRLGSLSFKPAAICRQAV